MEKLRNLLILFIMLTCLTGCNSKREISAMVGSSSIALSPTSAPIHTPTPTPTPEPLPVKKVNILSAGDVIMHDAVIRSGKVSDDLYVYDDIFNEIKPYAEKADFSIVSFEGVSLESDTNYTGYPLFNAPPAIISAFSYAGFDMVNTGNNHSLDRKLSGLLETRSIIKKNKMQVIGTYNDSAEPRHKIQDINGIKVGFLSYTYGLNMNENLLTQEERDTHLSLIDEEKIQQQIKTLSPMSDILVVLMHWGVEYKHEANKTQKDLADKMFQWGADIILGSHPHVVEPSEIREVNGETKYLIYGMGNFLSNQIGGNNPNERNNDFTEDSVLVNLEIEKDFNTGKTSLISVKHIPTWVYRYSVEGVYKYTIYPIPSPDLEMEDGKLAEKLINSYKRTMEKLRDFPSSGTP